MKKIQKRIEKLSFKKLLLIALLIRLILLPLSFHSDLNNNAIWGIYAEEFGLRGFYDWLNFGNYARPEYPPLAILMFLWVRKIWEVLFAFFWKLNITFSLFPSNFILWFETKGYISLLKLPGVIADIGIGVLIYNLVSLKAKRKAKYIASLFLFNPAVIYLSSLWGQIDSVVAFFGLLATTFVINKTYGKGMLSFLASIFVKALFVPAGLILGLRAWLNKPKLKELVRSAVILLSSLYLVGYLFIDNNYITWTINTYRDKFLAGSVTLPFINLNAFNFWGLILGLEKISTSVTFLGVELSLWAYGITTPIIFYIAYKFIKNKNIYFAVLVLYFAIFMFFPRIHERYLYMIFVFFPLVIFRYKKLFSLFLIVSVVFLLNLYHWWWFPEISPLVAFLDFEIVERSLSLINLVVFVSILRKYSKLPIKKT